jgi:O-antigen/teichoic acid export membrane protein
VLLTIEVSLALAFGLLYRSAEALVLAMLGAALVEVLLSHILISPRPRLQLDLKRVKQILRFGAWMNVQTVFQFLVKNLDDILVGKLLGAEMLGLYQMAYKITHSVVGEVGEVVSAAVLPVVAKMREQRERVRTLVKRALIGLGLFSGGLAVLGSIFREPLVHYVFGDSWSPIIPLLPWLFAAAALYAVVNLVGTVLIAQGMPKFTAVNYIFETAVMVTAILTLSGKYGLLGVSVAIFASRIAVVPLAVLFLVGLVWMM